MIRVYMRASTDDQDADRAKQSIKDFLKTKGCAVAGWYTENISGTKLDRPELSRLINDSESGDILFVEKLDRLTRLPYEQWESLKAKLRDKGLVVVVQDQPMTHSAFAESDNDTFTSRILTAFILDLSASQARDDYETRRVRAAQGIKKAKEQGKYKGRSRDYVKREAIRKLLLAGDTYSSIQQVIGCSPYLVQQVSRELKQAE
ncbi:recombinase family protein [Shewanella baltica]|uniref:recombinase family protein n=1 Tax=Shewanella baltica TaxID=62322 RepID=UPI00217D143F|nr:recombinase family protein [Shewanella baltica]MCS6236030.1 recombinase family protein [Shewanella baltica]MCS6271602.1 recombinase family protein [Shewanella baltica]